jgi:uncharacterized protein YcnI
VTARRSRRVRRTAALPRWGVRAAVAMTSLVAVSTASAHVVVLPSVVAKNTATEFTLQVPTERNIPTTAVRVMFPSQVTVYSFRVPPPGFTVTPILARNQTVIGAVFRGTIPVGRYQTFRFLGTAFSTGTTTWPAYQTYADGKIKPWTAAPGPSGAASPETGPTQPGPAASVAVVSSLAAASSGGTSTDETGIWLGVIAIAFAAGAAVLAGLLWTTRPARLPGDDGPPESR